jgi:hypothetical protein
VLFVLLIVVELLAITVQTFFLYEIREKNVYVVTNVILMFSIFSEVSLSSSKKYIFYCL